MGIGSKIGALLKEQGRSAAWLSRETEIPATTLRSMISRDSDRADIDALEKIASALGCSFVDLLGYEVDENKKTITVSSNEDFLHVQMAFREKARIKHETYKAITKCYEKLNTDGQKLLLGCAELLSASPSLIDNEPAETVIINDHTNETKNEADQEYGGKTEEGQERTSQDQ